MWRDYLSQGGDNTFAYVADEPTATCVGFVAGGPERTVQSGYRGELYALYVLADYQHKGIGRKLVSRSVEMFLAQGMASMLVWVLVGNPRRSFYRALGGHPVGKRVTTIGGRELAEIAYGWSSLRVPALGAVKD
ncbi:MAG: GNAT family N-acetyltransferase [Chloroflexi bacterium]|nr:GNAT family N-acetyltransferase [Chloroflexota bacterium]